MAGLIVEYAIFLYDASTVKDLVCNEWHNAFLHKSNNRLFWSTVHFVQ